MDEGFSQEIPDYRTLTRASYMAEIAVVTVARSGAI